MRELKRDCVGTPHRLPPVLALKKAGIGEMAEAANSGLTGTVVKIEILSHL